MNSSPTNKPIYVLDTHTLLWHLTQDKRLSTTVSALFEAAARGETRLVIPAILVAELYYLNQKRRIFPDFRALYSDLKAKPYFQFVDFKADEVLDFVQDSAIPDMHDRIIAGLARRIGPPLLTVDPLIAAAKVVEIVW